MTTHVLLFHWHPRYLTIYCMSMLQPSANPHFLGLLAKYRLKNSNRESVATGIGPSLSPICMICLSCALNAGQAGKPFPFGSPVAAKLRQ
jgi:hypothetical protein